MYVCRKKYIYIPKQKQRDLEMVQFTRHKDDRAVKIPDLDGILILKDVTWFVVLFISFYEEWTGWSSTYQADIWSQRYSTISWKTGVP